MTIQLPEGVSIDDEIQILPDRDDKRTRVRISLGGTKITVKVPHGHEHIAGLMMSALPGMMEAAYDALDEEEAQRDRDANDQ